MTQAQRPVKGRTVLIADDDQELILVMEFHFQSQGWTVETAGSGEAALKKIRTSHIDLLVSDIRMPDGTGIGLLRSLRRLKKQMRRAGNPEVYVPPIIIVTGLLENGEQYLRKLGAVGVFQKPAPIPTLLKLAADLVSEVEAKRSA